MCRLIGHEHTDSEIFTVQYLVKDMTHLMRYQQEFAPTLQEDIRKRYEGKYAVFRTVMEVVDHNEKM
jgi:TRAP-type C4-dicarboxylate transport system substrate-binding protein